MATKGAERAAEVILCGHDKIDTFNGRKSRAGLADLIESATPWAALLVAIRECNKQAWWSEHDYVTREGMEERLAEVLRVTRDALALAENA